MSDCSAIAFVCTCVYTGLVGMSGDPSSRLCVGLVEAQSPALTKDGVFIAIFTKDSVCYLCITKTMHTPTMCRKKQRNEEKS